MACRVGLHRGDWVYASRLLVVRVIPVEGAGSAALELNTLCKPGSSITFGFLQRRLVSVIVVK